MKSRNLKKPTRELRHREALLLAADLLGRRHAAPFGGPAARGTLGGVVEERAGGEADFVDQFLNSENIFHRSAFWLFSLSVSFKNNDMAARACCQSIGKRYRNADES